MHKYRTAARQEAWYTNQNDTTTNFNPFQKIRPRRKIDEEYGLTPLAHSQSESAVLNLQNGKDREYTSPPHANTMPVSSASPSGPSNIEHVAFDGEHKEPSQDSGTGTSDTIVEDRPVDAPTPTTGPRRRLRFFDKLSHRKQENTGNERTRTSESKRAKSQFTLWGQIRATLFNSWINILLIMVPVGIAVEYAHIDPVIVFVLNFIAIIPLAAMLSFATEEIALHTGETIGGLLNATFGNAVELIVSIIALVADEIVIVQTSLIGSMLSNLLLVLGMAFLLGGANRLEQHFNVTVAQTATSLLSLAVASLIIPAAFHAWATGDQEHKDVNITSLSRGTAILLLLVYAAYLFFQLKTHATMYNEPSKKVEKRRVKPEGGDTSKNLATMGAGISASMGGPSTQGNPTQQPDDREEPQLYIWVAVLTLAISTAFVALCAEFMVGSVNALTERSGINKTFVGLILLPIVGNAAEHATAVTVAIKDKMDLAIGVAVGSSMQIALLIVPFVVMIGWIMGKDDMNLDFDGFQIAVLFVTVLLVNYLIADGKSHWLEGVLLMTLYLIVAVAAWYYPAAEETGTGGNGGG